MHTARAIAEDTLAALAGWRLARLRDALAGPLAVVATGGSFAAALLWARLHERAGYPAWALTPADCVRRPMPPGTRVLILSSSGRHHDVLRAARDIRPVYAVVGDRSAPLCDLARQTSGDAIIVPRFKPRGLADPRLLVPFITLAAALYDTPAGLLRCFETPPDARPPALDGRPPRVLALGAGLSAPAAADLANRCRESGLAPAQASDWRDVAHGDLLALDPRTTWTVLLGMPGDAASLARYVAHLPEGSPYQVLIASREGVPGSIELLHRAGALAWDAMDHFSAHPAIATLPDWFKGLYRLADEG